MLVYRRVSKESWNWKEKLWKILVKMGRGWRFHFHVPVMQRKEPYKGMGFIMVYPVIPGFYTLRKDVSSPTFPAIFYCFQALTCMNQSWRLRGPQCLVIFSILIHLDIPQWFDPYPHCCLEERPWYYLQADGFKHVPACKNWKVELKPSNYFLRVILTLIHYSDIASDKPSGSHSFWHIL